MADYDRNAAYDLSRFAPAEVKTAPGTKEVRRPDKPEIVQEKIKTARETLGRYFYDLSKTSFGTGLLGTFLPYFTKDESAMTEKTIWLFAGCLIATVGFAYVGNKILKR